MSPFFSSIEVDGHMREPEFMAGRSELRHYKGKKIESE
jgi:hypothetical protein